MSKQKIIIVLSIILLLLLCTFLVAYSFIKNNHVQKSTSSNESQSNINNESYDKNQNELNSKDFYYKNSKVIKVEDFKASTSTYSESEIVSILLQRGFEKEVEYDFSLDGELNEGVADEKSGIRHPNYLTIYLDSKNRVWSILVIGKSIIANPVDYNMENNTGIEVIVSETEAVWGIDYDNCKFYINIPNKDAERVIVIKRIDAKSLDELEIK